MQAAVSLAQLSGGCASPDLHLPLPPAPRGTPSSRCSPRQHHRRHDRRDGARHSGANLQVHFHSAQVWRWPAWHAALHRP